MADRLGYHEVWIGEHLTERWENAPAPELLIAQALLKTEKIILATGVTLLALHNPVEVAHRIAMLDHLARGRFYWGIGGGAIPTDLALFGLDPSRPAEVRARSAEALDVILKLWASEGQFSYHGKFFNVNCTGYGPGEGSRLLHEAVSKTPSAHRCGGDVTGLQVDSAGWGARVDTDE